MEHTTIILINQESTTSVGRESGLLLKLGLHNYPVVFWLCPSRSALSTIALSASFAISLLRMSRLSINHSYSSIITRFCYNTMQKQ
jgi:hypothetical protein